MKALHPSKQLRASRERSRVGQRFGVTGEGDGRARFEWSRTRAGGAQSSINGLYTLPGALAIRIRDAAGELFHACVVPRRANSHAARYGAGRSAWPNLTNRVMIASRTTRSVESSSRMSRTSCSVGMLSLSSYFRWRAATASCRSAAAFIRLLMSGSCNGDRTSASGGGHYRRVGVEPPARAVRPRCAYPPPPTFPLARGSEATPFRPPSSNHFCASDRLRLRTWL